MRMMDTPSSSPLNLNNTPSYSHAFNGLPSKFPPPDHVYSPQVHKQTLGPDVYSDISSNITQRPAEDLNIAQCSVDSSISPPCAITDDLDMVTRQTTGQPNCSPSDHQFTDVRTNNELSIPSTPNIYSGSFANSDSNLATMTGSWDRDIPQSGVPDLQPDPCLSSLSLLPGLLMTSKDVSDDCVPPTIAPHLPALPPSLFLKISHASYNAYNNNSAESESVTDETLTSHAGFACSHRNTFIDFALDHSKIPIPVSFQDCSEEGPDSHTSRAPSPSLETQDMGIQEDFTSSPPLSPSMSSAYMPSSSPIPSSSPGEPSLPTPPTSSPSSPVKDAQFWRSDSEFLIPGTRKFNSVSLNGTISLSNFTEQHNQSMILSEVSLQHQVPISSPLDHCVESSGAVLTVAENSSHTPSTITATTNTEGEDELSKESHTEAKRQGPNIDAHRLNAIPYPKRPTIAAHRLQQKKLAQPFRSPILSQVPKVEPKPKGADAVASPLSTVKEDESSKEPLSFPTLDSKIKYRTTRAANQFKSPLSAPNALDDSSLVRLTPTIQALERKLQILKRAVKVREDVQEEVLEGLVKKWSEAGREVAWEVWNLVKDNASSDGNSQTGDKGKRRAFEGSWGWESGDAKRRRVGERERNWGWDVVPISGRNEGEQAEEEEEEEEEEAGVDDEAKHSLGTMLMQLGVAPDTLGWVEEEGSFIDK